MTVLAQVAVLVAGLGVIRVRLVRGAERTSWTMGLIAAWVWIQLMGWGAGLYWGGWWPS
jgi:hypothetical protein